MSCKVYVFTARRSQEHIRRLHGGRNGGNPTIVSLELTTKDEVITRGTGGGGGGS